LNGKARYLMIGLVCLALLLTSCRRLNFAEPTVRPTITPTPRSTHLPPVPTAVPVGAEDNPLNLKMVAPETVRSERSLDTALTELGDALLEETQLHVTVELVNSDAEALAALCDSAGGDVSAAWLSGLAYAAAYASGCGSAALQVERGSRATAANGEESWIIVNPEAEIAEVSGLVNHTFCRLGVSDVYSWLIPTLMMRANGIESTADLELVIDYTDPSEMIDDVESGRCDAAGIAGSQFDEFASASARASVDTLEESTEIPYLVLVYPNQLGLGEQQKISDALVSIGNGSRADLLNPFLEQEQLVAVTDSDFSTLRSFISNAGIDLSQAGN
jgi:ABC-type phosphate/phosphonate transport system substrate-binding protein